MKRLALFLVTAGVLSVPSTALGADDTVSGTTVDSLALSLSTPTGVLTNLRPDNTSTNATPAALTVVSTDPDAWTITVRDADFATSVAPGKLVATTPDTGLCTGSTDNLAQPLGFSTAAALGSTIGGLSGSLPSTGTAVNAATGTGSQIAEVTYSQEVGPTEQLRTGCIYQVTAEYTLVGS